MPKNLNPYSRPQGGFVTTWTEVATGGAGADPECTRAAETGKSHFITFIVCNTDNTDPGHTVKVYLRSVEKTAGPEEPVIVYQFGSGRVFKENPKQPYGRRK